MLTEQTSPYPHCGHFLSLPTGFVSGLPAFATVIRSPLPDESGQFPIAGLPQIRLTAYCGRMATLLRALRTLVYAVPPGFQQA